MNRFDRKHEAILVAAAEAFLRNGFRGTSMDEVAARAGVSKQTVYKHFADKERLFTEIVAAAVDEASGRLELPDGGDVEADLRALARGLLERAMQPRLLALRRLVIAEAPRFPELGRAFYERGQGRSVETLAQAFERRRELRLDDPRTAAQQFTWLVMANPINRAMLLGTDEPPDDLDAHVDAAVRAFLAAYGPR